MASSACPHCGVPDCDDLFHRCLELDYTDSRYGTVHHLVVSAYVLQHGWSAHDVRASMSEFVLAHLDRAPSAHAMRRIRAAVDGPARVRRRPEDDPTSPPRTGADRATATIADVDTSSPEAYRRTVRTWAHDVAHAAAGEMSGLRKPAK